MDRRLLTDAVADLDRLSTIEDAVMFRSLYLQAFKEALKLPQEEADAPAGVRVRVEIEGLKGIEAYEGALTQELSDSLVGTCTGIATASLIAIITGLQTGQQHLVGLPAECVRLISKLTIQAAEGEGR